MKKEIFTCDVCGVQRKEVNRWWIVTDTGLLSLEHWSETAANAKGSRHFCGQDCVHKFVDDFMSKKIPD